MNTSKAFDSLDQNFVTSTLEKYGFGQKFILYLSGKDEPISALFLLIKIKHEIAGMTFFDHYYLYLYPDITFFLKQTISTKDMVLSVLLRIKTKLIKILDYKYEF